MDAVASDDLELLAETLRKTMAASSGHELDKALADLGWLEMLGEMPEAAIPLVFKLFGETGTHAPVLNDVVLNEAGRPVGETVPLPFAGGSWVLWERTDQPSSALDEDLPLHRVTEHSPAPLAAGRRALGWWLVGTSRAMLSAGAPPRAGSCPVRASGRFVSSHPSSAGRDARRHRGCRSDAEWSGRRPELAAGQGRRGPAPRSPRHGTASRSSAASASRPNTNCTAMCGARWSSTACSGARANSPGKPVPSCGGEDQRRGSWISESRSPDALHQTSTMRRIGNRRCSRSRRRGQLS